MKKSFFLYIMASQERGTLYIGVTSDLIKRVHEHKNGIVEGFTRKYGTHRLVFMRLYGTPKRLFHGNVR